MRRHQMFLHTALAVGVAAGAARCATTTTRIAEIDPARVEAEAQKQRELALATHHADQARLDDIAFPLLVAAAPLCKKVAPRAGFRSGNVHAYEGQWRRAAAALGLGDTLQVLGVARGSPAARAGLQPGDRLLRVGEYEAVAGPKAGAGLGAWLDAQAKAGRTRLPVTFRRGGEVRSVTLELEPACDYPALVVVSGDLNAYADGEAVYVTSAMMRFADDGELAVIVAHELAHNAMGHLEAKRTNALLGALLGALGDIALASSGVNTGGYYAARGAEAGALVFSQDFEREADYVAIYILALAGHPLDAAPLFWRHMAIADPRSIALARTHPTSAERFVRMEAAIAEVAAKRARGLELRPEPKRPPARR